MLHVIPDIASGSPKNADPADPFRRTLAYGLKTKGGVKAYAAVVKGAELLIIELFIYYLIVLYESSERVQTSRRTPERLSDDNP
jgi:hypothetical protein